MDENEVFSPAEGEEEMPSMNTLSLPMTVASVREIVNRYTHCVFCGANMHFTHVTDFAKNLTQETARCPECGMKANAMLHRLQ